MLIHFLFILSFFLGFFLYNQIMEAPNYFWLFSVSGFKTLICLVCSFWNKLTNQVLHPVSDVIRSIRDPEKPNTLEELDVVTEKCVEVQELGEDEYLIIIKFSPTVPHCSLATLIGESLCWRRGNYWPHLNVSYGKMLQNLDLFSYFNKRDISEDFNAI